MSEKMGRKTKAETKAAVEQAAQLKILTRETE